MDLITLIGNIEENFYQLGQKDRELGKFVYSDMKAMLRTPWAPLNNLIEEIGKNILKNSLLKKSEYFHCLRSYCEGSNLPLEEFVYVMIIPEIVSCMSKWAPGFIKGNFGCSTFMSRNQSGDIVHGRILDFPLQGNYDRYERAILYDLQGMPKTLGFGTVGMPYPSITLMTEDGITLALHQKFTNIFNPQGIPIFEYIFRLITAANDKKSILEFVKAHQTITTWCLYVTFKNGDALGIDLSGQTVFVTELHIPDSGILYFCNHLENKSIDQRQFLPLGFDQYNHMREQIAKAKIEKVLKEKKRALTDLELLQVMTTPFSQNLKEDEFKNYALDNITSSSLSAMVLNPTKNQALYLAGPAPKVFRDNVIELTDCFSRVKQEAVKIKKDTSVDSEYFLGLQSMMLAQKGFDLDDSIEVYHHLQMAIDYLEHYPEKKIAQFYFLVARYLYEKQPSVLPNLLGDFKKFVDKLPPYLNDQCLMFIGRLERILKVSSSELSIDQIQTEKLREVYLRELKIPRALLHLTSKKMIIPRIDILDIIYVLTT